VGLDELLERLHQNEDPKLLVGFKTNDDAAVYRINHEVALVTSADFITPPVNDPYTFGQIAAANALSDIYAMGGRPILCLSLVAFPSKKLESEVLHQIVAGSMSKITEAGAVLGGGHSIEDEEPKFGLAVTGTVHPDKYWSNGGAKSGDVLVLTKPIGSGVLFNANIKNWVSAQAMEQCITTISMLNRVASEIMGDFEIHAATDITGFGLAGHSFEMARASNVTLEIEVDRLPIMTEALEMYEKGMTTGVNRYNEQLVSMSTRLDKEWPDWHRQIIYDPQTSGGLMVSVPENQGELLVQAFHEKGVEKASIIGRVKPLEGSTMLIFH